MLTCFYSALYFTFFVYLNFLKILFFDLFLALLFVLKQKVTKNSRIYKLAALKQNIFIAYAHGSTKIQIGHF